MSTNIDRIDSFILRDLLNDGRKSFTQIAKDYNTTKEIIANHYNKMKKNGIIVGSTIQNDASAVYGSKFVAGFFLSAPSKKWDELYPLVLKLPNVAFVRQFGARSGLVVGAFLKDAKELDEIKNSLKNLPFIQGVETTSIITAVRTTPQNLSILKTEKDRKNTKADETEDDKRTEKVEIDQMDKDIIERLVRNGRTPFSKIAKDLKASTDTIARRYEKLRKNNIIKVIIQINPTKIGYPAYAVINLTFSEDNSRRAIEFFKQTDDIVSLMKTSGRFDIFPMLMIRDIAHFTDIQEKILNLPGLTDINIVIDKTPNCWPPPREHISTF